MTHMKAKTRKPRPPKLYPVPEQNRVLMRDLLLGLDRAQAWKLNNPNRSFSDYIAECGR